MIVKKNKYSDFVVNITLFFLVINLVFFSNLNVIPYIKGDGWRFIDIYLFPWINGTFSFSDLFVDKHSLPIVASLFLINAEFFGLRTDYEVFFGLLFLFLTALLILSAMIKRKVNNYGIFATSFVLLGMTQTIHLSWSLVTLGYIVIFFGVLYIIFIQKFFFKELNKADAVFITFVSSIFLIFFGNIPKIILVSAFIFFLINYFYTYKSYNLKINLCILLSIFIYYLFFNTYIEKNNDFSLNFDKLINFDFVIFCKYIGVAFLSAFLNIKDISNSLNLNTIIIEFLGLILFFSYIYTLLICLKKNNIKKNFIPGMFILIGIIVAIFAYIFRFLEFDLTSTLNANIPRYYKLYSLPLIGFIWFWSYQLNFEKKLLFKPIIYFFFTLLLANFYSFYSAWNLSKYIRHSNYLHSQILIDHANGNFSKEISFHVKGHHSDDFIHEKLFFLKKNQLNIFDDEVYFSKSKH